MVRLPLLTIIFAFLGILKAQSSEVSSELLFAHKIQPLFKAKCLTCHGEAPNNKIKGDLDMRLLGGLIRGGESGEPSIVVGDASKSPLYLAVTRVHENDWSAMPPKENDRLDGVQIGYIKDWINGGAVWPSDKRIAKILDSPDPWDTGKGIRVKTSGGIDPVWTNRKYEEDKLWAYQGLGVIKVPGELHPID